MRVRRRKYLREERAMKRPVTAKVLKKAKPKSELGHRGGWRLLVADEQNRHREAG